jgi:glycosyltransferase involved in cell wall biosynthesis
VQRTVLIVPCFNEAQRLPVEAFRSFLADSKSVDFVLVDDGSTDGTAERLAEIRAGAEERVRVLALPHNVGKAEAVRRGIRLALEGAAEGVDAVGYWDADLATPLDAVERLRGLLDANPRLEMVLGARVNLLGRHIRRNPWRHYLGRIFATAVSVALGVAVYDTQCGAKLFRVTPDLPALFEEPFETRWLFDVEILARLQRLRRQSGGPPLAEVVAEYPLETWVDVEGSKVRTSDFVAAVAGLWRIRRRYRPGRP